MVSQLSPTLLKILSSTVLEVERALELPKGDPALRELKQAVLLALGELETKRAAVSTMRILLIKSDLGSDLGPYSGPHSGPDFAGRDDPVERERGNPPSERGPKERSERGAATLQNE